MIARIPFGRFMLFFIITTILFGVFGLLFGFISDFFLFYRIVAAYSAIAAATSLVFWLIVTLFVPKSLLMPGSSLMGIKWMTGCFAKFRMSGLHYCR